MEENLKKIKEMRSEINDLKTSAKNFNPKKCDSCSSALSLPTIHFMCGHTFHDQCIESDNGRRFCGSCVSNFKDIMDKKEQYDVQAVDTLIGDIVPPESLMKTLTDRKLAEQVTLVNKAVHPCATAL